MTDELLVQFERTVDTGCQTPADILNRVATWESDLLHSSSPLIEEQLRSAIMGNSERVDAFSGGSGDTALSCTRQGS